MQRLLCPPIKSARIAATVYLRTTPIEYGHEDVAYLNVKTEAVETKCFPNIRPALEWFKSKYGIQDASGNIQDVEVLGNGSVFVQNDPFYRQKVGGKLTSVVYVPVPDHEVPENLLEMYKTGKVVKIIQSWHLSFAEVTQTAAIDEDRIVKAAQRWRDASKNQG